MQLRLLEYFVVLAREKHFARAAEACNVSQPALSAGLASLEDQLGKRLVTRERRFVDLTADGAMLLPLAQQVLSLVEDLHQTVEPGGLRGELKLGVIPAAMPAVGVLLQAVAAAHPDVTTSVRSLTSREIERGLAAFELDAGITYLDHEPPAQVISIPLYRERPVFLVSAQDGDADAGEIGLAEALARPLCLLHPGMQNRRILDTHLAARGHAARPAVIADSYVALLALVEGGGLASIIPDTYGRLLPTGGPLRVIPFSDPLPTSRIGLIVADRAPVGAMAKAALGAAQAVVLPAGFGPL